MVEGIMSRTNYKYKMVKNACWDTVTPSTIAAILEM